MSDIIYTPPVSSGGGVNPTSTYMPVNIGGTFVDSIIQCLPNTFAQSMRGASGFGFGTNISGTSCESFLGDPNNQIDGIFLQVKNDTTSSRIFTANRGFYLDYVINRYIFGDWASVYNKTQFVIDDQNELIYTKNNLVNTGLSFDFNIRQFLFGSYGAGNLTYLSIEDSLSTISTKYQTNEIGIKLDFSINSYKFGLTNNGYLVMDTLGCAIVFNSNIYFQVDSNNNYYQFGDSANGNCLIISPNSGFVTLSGQGVQFLYYDTVNNVSNFGSQGSQAVFLSNMQNNFCAIGDVYSSNNGTQFLVDDSIKTIYTTFGGSENGMRLELASKNYFYGDYNTVGNGTQIRMKDSTKSLALITNGGTITNTCDLLNFDGSLTTGSSSGFSGNHLQVTINGIPYVIRLENP